MADSIYNKTLYILGEASYGPTNQPVNVTGKDQCLQEFGDGKLSEAWNEAFQIVGDNANIYLVRVNGTPSVVTIRAVTSRGRVYEALKITSYHSGSEWNDMCFIVGDEYITIQNPDSIGGNVVLYYESYPTMYAMAEAINYAFETGMIAARAYCTEQFAPVEEIKEYYSDSLWEPFYFYEGEDELHLTKNELHEKLEMTYNILIGQQIDIITVVGCYFDDISPLAYYGDTKYSKLFYSRNRDYLQLPHETKQDMPATFHGQLIRFCQSQMTQAVMTHAVMPFNPLQNVEEIMGQDSYFMKAINTTCLADRHDLSIQTDTETKDFGRYLSLTLGEFMYKDMKDKFYYNNGYIGYAAMLASNLSSESTTNMTIPGISRLRYHLEDKEAEYLSKLGVVTFRKSILKDAIVVTNGVTAAMSTTPYHVVSNVRMVQLIMCAFNKTMAQYVGEDVDKLKKSGAMKKEVDRLVEQVKSENVAKDLKVDLIISNDGIALLDISVLCNYSIEYVSASTHVKL